MHIPDKYRDRYNRLARSHPWMREMRDETETIGDLIEKRKEEIEERNHLIAKARNSFKSLAESNYDYAKFRKACRRATEIMDAEMGRMGIASDGRALEAADEPTNGIGSETNGIANDSPLVEPCTSEDEKVQGLPDDNVLYLLRDVAKKSDGHTLYHGATKLMQAIGKEPEDRCETGSELAIALNTLADMVERDYVYRPIYDATEAERSELFRRCLELTDERDELTNAVNELQNKQPYCYVPEKPLDTLNTIGRYIDELQAERDELERECRRLKTDAGQLKKKLDAYNSQASSMYKDTKAQAELDVANELRELRIKLESWEYKYGKLEAERDEWKAKAESALHENPYVGLVRGKQWERTEISDYYCGRCWWKVTDHDSYCPECGGALHKASNKPDSKFDARKTAETPETDAAKGDIRDFDADSRENLGSNLGTSEDFDGRGTEVDSREKLEADVRSHITISVTPHKEDDGVLAPYATVLEWLDRQKSITERECEAICFSCVTEQDGMIAKLRAENAELRDECCDCAVKRANRVLSQSVDRLTRERDALAVDLADAMAPHAVEMRVKLDDGAILPHRAHATDAGADLFAPHDVVIPARGSATVDTGVHVQIPGGCCGLLVSKSGLNVKCNIWDTGLVDEGYGGSIVVKLYNLGDFDVKLPAGSKISQLVVLPVLYPRIVQADEIAAGPRGSNGFGSSDAPLTTVDGDGEVVS